MKYRAWAVVFILIAMAIGYFDVLHIVSPDSGFAKPFKLGLDLKGGVHLVYKADVSAIKPGEISNKMADLRSIIERRINDKSISGVFGVLEPLVQTKESGIAGVTGKREQQLIIDLPGVTDIEQAIKMIGQTPILEFRTEKQDIKEGLNVLDAYEPTELTGRYLKDAKLDFNPTTYEPVISLEFDDEGAQLFAQMTKDNIGKTIAIFLDGAPLSMPTVREEIPNGKAQISGKFTADEAKAMVEYLDGGSLPIPISKISQQTIGPTLGERALRQGIIAGIYGVIFVALFLILWYRLPGLIAVLALMVYVAIVLALFKIMSVTLTAAGIAGFILSIGMAVDANILIFERMKEERRAGKSLTAAVSEGFGRAWLSIRDSNVSTLISATILFWMGTSMVKGFAVTLILGVLASMFTAITVSRTFLMALGVRDESRVLSFLFGSGLFNKSEARNSKSETNSKSGNKIY